jgi:hypothetical protein
MSNQAMTTEQAARLKSLVSSIKAKGGRSEVLASTTSTPCQIYRADVRPLVEEALPIIKLIPGVGEEAAAIIETLEKLADTICA